MERIAGLALAAAFALAAAALCGCIASTAGNGQSQLSQLNDSLQAAVANSTQLSDELAQAQWQLAQAQQENQNYSGQLAAQQSQLAAQRTSQISMLQQILASLQANSTASPGVTLDNIRANYTAVTDFACQLYFTAGFYNSNSAPVPASCIIPIGNLFIALQQYISQPSSGTNQSVSLVQSDLDTLAANSTS